MIAQTHQRVSGLVPCSPLVAKMALFFCRLGSTTLLDGLVTRLGPPGARAPFGTTFLDSGMNEGRQNGLSTTETIESLDYRVGRYDKGYVLCKVADSRRWSKDAEASDIVIRVIGMHPANENRY